MVRRLVRLTVPDVLSAEIDPLLAVMESLHQQISAADARLAEHAAADPVVRRLAAVPNTGPVTALSFVATLDQVERFGAPHQMVPPPFASPDAPVIHATLSSTADGRMTNLAERIER